MSGRSCENVRRPPFADNDRTEDAVLMQRIRARDLDAFEELYRSYRDRLTRFLAKRIRPPQLIEEVLNDTLMVIWNRPDSFNGDSKLSTWIFAIAYRKAMKALRSHREPVEDRAAEERVSPDPNPEEGFGRQRTRSLLLQAMAELSPEHRTVLDLTYFHELGYQEIADIMSCPVGTVKTRMFHARRQMRRRLAGDLPDWL